MEFYRTNVLQALHIAIREARWEDTKAGLMGDSAFVRGLEELYKHVHTGAYLIQIRD